MLTMAEGGIPSHVNNHAHKCEQILKVNGTKVLRKLLEDRVNKKWKFPLEELLSANSANGTIRQKCHQLRQLFDSQKFNPSESDKIKAGINEFDISLLTKLLKNPRVSGINVTEASWKTLGGETVAFMFCPNIPGTDPDDEDMKLAGLVCVLQFYRNNIIGHDTYCSKMQGSEYFKEADEHIRRAVKEIAEILKLPATELKFENTVVVRAKHIQDLKRHLDQIDAEIDCSTKSGTTWPPKSAIHNWTALMLRGDIVPESKNEYMHTLPDYIPLKLLSIPGCTATSKDQLNSCLESGVRLFKLKSADNISGVLDQISQYLDKYSSETVIIWMAANNCSPLNRLEHLDFNKHKELKDVRGKILVLDINHFGNQDHVKVYDKKQSDADWDEIQAHIQQCARYDTIDSIKRGDFVITVLGTESATGNMQHLLYRNKELISCGGMILMENIALNTEITNQILCISQRYKCMIDEIVRKDTRLPKLSNSDKSNKSRMKRFAEGFSPYQTALIEAFPVIRIVLDEEMGQNSSYFTSFLDQLITSLEDEARIIIDMEQYSQILMQYCQYGVNLALSSLLAVMQRKGADDIDEFVQALGVESLVYYVKELIQKCSKLSRFHNNNTSADEKIQVENIAVAVKIKTKQSTQGSVGNVNTDDLLQNDPTAFTTNVTDALGSNPRAVDGCIEIQMELADEWQFENLKKSVEHGVFLDSYCAWLRANGKTIKEEEEVSLSVTFNREVYHFPVQKTTTAKPKIKPTPSNWIVHVFMELAPRVESKWKRLAKCLGFDDDRILRFQETHKKLSDSILQMLIEWKVKTRKRDRDLLEKFITALCDCDLQHLLKDVEEIVSQLASEMTGNVERKESKELEGMKLEKVEAVKDVGVHEQTELNTTIIGEKSKQPQRKEYTFNVIYSNPYREKTAWKEVINFVENLVTVLEEEKEVRCYYARRDCRPRINSYSEAERVIANSEYIILVLNGGDSADKLDIYHYMDITHEMDPKKIWFIFFNVNQDIVTELLEQNPVILGRHTTCNGDFDKDALQIKQLINAIQKPKAPEKPGCRDLSYDVWSFLHHFQRLSDRPGEESKQPQRKEYTFNVIYSDPYHEKYASKKVIKFVENLVTVLEEEKDLRCYYARRDCRLGIDSFNEAAHVMENSEYIILVLNGRDSADEYDIYHYIGITHEMDPQKIWFIFFNVNQDIVTKLLEKYPFFLGRHTTCNGDLDKDALQIKQLIKAIQKPIQKAPENKEECRLLFGELWLFLHHFERLRLGADNASDKPDLNRQIRYRRLFESMSSRSMLPLELPRRGLKDRDTHATSNKSSTGLERCSLSTEPTKTETIMKFQGNRRDVESEHCDDVPITKL